MTHIAPFDGPSNPASLGFAAKRVSGSRSRTAPTTRFGPGSASPSRSASAPVSAAASALAGAAFRISGFEHTARLPSPPAATRWALCALGVVMGRAATAAVASGLADAASNAAVSAATTWRDSRRRGKVGIDPAALHLRSTPARPREAAEPVSVLIAMRHQPDPAIAAVRAALCQRGVDHLDIVVLDDGCPQETRSALRREFGDDPRVRILAAAPLPRGWSPNAHRSHQLAVAARGRVLIFAEPCAPLGPHAAAAATALLRGEQLDLAVLDTGRPAQTSPGWQADRGADGHAPMRSGSNAQQAAARARASAGDREHDRDREAAAKGESPAARRPMAQRPPTHHRHGRAHGGLGRIHPGRFTVAVDADAYWRIGGYRAAATDPDPLALLRTVRRASGRVAVADGRRVIPPAQLLEPLPAPDPQAEALWDSQHSSRASITGTARRVLAALVGARA